MSVPFPFVNFTAGLRKPALIPFGYFSPSDSISWIQSIPSDIAYTQAPLSGTIDGSNRVFTIPGTFSAVIAIIRNGIVLDPAVAYVLVGSTVTFTNSIAYIPRPGDDLQALTS